MRKVRPVRRRWFQADSFTRPARMPNCGSCGRMMRASQSGCKASRSVSTIIVMESMKVMPISQCIIRLPKRFLLLKLVRSSALPAYNGSSATSRTQPRRKGSPIIFMIRSRLILKTAVPQARTREIGRSRPIPGYSAMGSAFCDGFRMDKLDKHAIARVTIPCIKKTLSVMEAYPTAMLTSWLRRIACFSSCPMRSTSARKE
mmetsp:Transcript_4264/g.16693  ORF Transcript_4264/g.16693 Transcript_4264/m.16693 type:complete len:202 (+) Transcript_4264:2694-3299(+)